MGSFNNLFEVDCRNFDSENIISTENIEKVKTYTITEEETSKSLFQKLLIITLTFISTLLIGASLVSLLTLIFNNNDISFFYTLNIIILILPAAAFIIKKKTTLGYTLYTLGSFMLAGITLGSYFDKSFYEIYFIISTLIFSIAIFRFDSRSLKVIYISFVYLISYFYLAKRFDISDNYPDHFPLFAFFTIFSCTIYYISTKLKNKKTFSPIKKHYLIEPLQINSIFYIFLFALLFTFYNDKDETGFLFILPYITNWLFFIISTITVIFSVKKHIQHIKVISLLYWSMFLIYKYYDIFWKLLHKSIILIVAGIILITIAFIISKRKGIFKYEN